MFGPLYAYVCPLDLEWWVFNLAKAQAEGAGFSTNAGEVDLFDEQVASIEDVFADASIAPGQMRLRQHPPEPSV